MNVTDWIDYYEGNRGTFAEPDWNAPCTLPEETRSALAASLAIFQLGESGEGKTVRRYAAKRRHLRTLENYPRALALFVREEQHHASLLAKGVRYLGGRLLEKQWSASCFSRLRHLVNLEFSIQVLVTAELLGLAYYAQLRRHCGDPVVASMCGRLVRDEVRHIAFHIDFLRVRLRSAPRFLRFLWAMQFRMLFAIVQRVVWHDHGKCLRALGGNRPAFMKATRRSAAWFARQVLERAPGNADSAALSKGVEALAP